MPSAKQCWPFSNHRYTLPDPAQRVCNTTVIPNVDGVIVAHIVLIPEFHMDRERHSRRVHLPDENPVRRRKICLARAAEPSVFPVVQSLGIDIHLWVIVVRAVNALKSVATLQFLHARDLEGYGIRLPPAARQPRVLGK